MSIACRTWDVGATRNAVIVQGAITVCGVAAQMAVDGLQEGHILTGDARDASAKTGDKGVLTFTEGGPTGGYWKFRKD